MSRLNEHHPHRTGTPQSVHGGKSSAPALPVEPGTTPLPAGMIRGYHYTGAIDSVLANGLDVSYARGSSYGEPNVIWFSTTKPSDDADFVEVHLRPEEVLDGHPAIAGSSMTQAEIDWMHGIGANFNVSTPKIGPDRIVTHSKAWHGTARTFMRDYSPDTPAGKAARRSGEFDWMSDDPRFAPALSFWLAQFGVSEAVVVMSDGDVDGRPLPPLYEAYLRRSIERMTLVEANPDVPGAVKAIVGGDSLRRRIRAIRSALTLEADLLAVEQRVMAEIGELLEGARQLTLERLQVARQSWDIHQAQLILIELERQQIILDDAITSAIRDALDDALFKGQQQATLPLRYATIEISIAPMISTRFLTVSVSTLPHLIKGLTDQMIDRVGSILRQGVLAQKSPFDIMVEIGKVPGIRPTSDLLRPFRFDPKAVRQATRGEGPFAKAFRRAETITRTEIGRIAQTANWLTLDQLTIDDPRFMKEWGAVDDARTRPWHAAADGQRVGVREPFRIGGENLMYPHDPRASGRNTINCRCISIPWHPFFDDPEG